MTRTGRAGLTGRTYPTPRPDSHRPDPAGAREESPENGSGRRIEIRRPDAHDAGRHPSASRFRRTPGTGEASPEVGVVWNAMNIARTIGGR
ncbi:hypothetical protein GCM10022215_07060 [Nocardioides fonticola]|uniref:Uncharacterized protein n=1 Tax=Nocardioides fonticola TaxID=450363 RepID=A0ABP7XC90_9ACTN